MENIHAGFKIPKSKDASGNNENAEEEAEEEEEEEDIESKDEDDLQRRREKFVRHAIRRKNNGKKHDSELEDKVETIYEVRRAIIKEFLAVCTKTKTCGTCKGCVTRFSETAG